VPKVLVSGDHQAVAAWRKREAHAWTRRRRPDLLKKATQLEKGT
jgi:tRNA (guanine37-N1)-methyltransferase